MGDAEPDEWNQPFTASAEWWQALPGKVRDVLITGGTDEVMVDDIMDFAKKIEVGSTWLYFTFPMYTTSYFKRQIIPIPRR